MRISRKAKAENRGHIIKTAARLFIEKGYDVTTIRGIAAEAGLAPSSMFNYFNTKEALAMTLVSDALTAGQSLYRSRVTGREGLAEDIFLLITSELRQLKPYRKFAGTVIEKTMGLFPKSSACPEGEAIKEEHLKLISEITSRHGCSSVSEPVASSLYLSLYLGILAFWFKDGSRNQEETLALIDYSLQLFSHTITGGPHS